MWKNKFNIFFEKKAKNEKFFTKNTKVKNNEILEEFCKISIKNNEFK